MCFLDRNVFWFGSMNFIHVDATDEKASSLVQVIINKPLTD